MGTIIGLGAVGVLLLAGGIYIAANTGKGGQVAPPAPVADRRALPPPPIDGPATTQSAYAAGTQPAGAGATQPSAKPAATPRKTPPAARKPPPPPAEEF